MTSQFYYDFSIGDIPYIPQIVLSPGDCERLCRMYCDGEHRRLMIRERLYRVVLDWSRWSWHKLSDSVVFFIFFIFIHELVAVIGDFSENIFVSNELLLIMVDLIFVFRVFHRWGERLEMIWLANTRKPFLSRLLSKASTQVAMLVLLAYSVVDPSWKKKRPTWHVRRTRYSYRVGWEILFEIESRSTPYKFPMNQERFSCSELEVEHDRALTELSKLIFWASKIL